MPHKGDLTVPSSDRVFQVLGNNDYNDIDLISELIDNAIAARVDELQLEINIEVGVSEDNPDESYFLIRDNAAGIRFEDLPRAISPAGVTDKSGHPLNEHGLGMKQAIAAAGELEYLKTKPLEEDTATVVSEFSYGPVEYETEDVDWEHGTEIRIGKLNEILLESDQVYTQRIKSYLGARYRRLLGRPNEVLNIIFKWKDLDEGESRKFHPAPVRPIYFHPNKRQNRPIIHKKEFSGSEGSGWKVELTFGYAPQDESEYKELGLQPPKYYEPYNRALSKQGLDLIRHDRIIQFHQLSEIGLVNAAHNQYNDIRGEIDLIDGFSTAITKNKIIVGDELDAMITQIREYLNKHDYLEDRTVPSDIPEPCLRDRLASLLEKPPFNCEDVETEYVVGALEGFIDIKADTEAWELKVNQADGLDIYQLFAYMDMQNIDQGHIVSDGISTGASEAIKHIEEEHGKSIESIDREDLAINHPMSEAEIEKYV